jgi:RimJ/RimL family protein N-acetyltransferase
LEPLTAEHAEEMFRLLCDREIYRFIEDEPPASVAALAAHYQRWQSRRSPDGSQRWLNWVMRSLESGLCIGFIQATIYPPQTADFAFVLGSTYWSRGFAFEASVAVLHALFTGYAVASIFATTDRRNARSRSLLTRLGFDQIEPAAYPHDGVLPGDDAFRLIQTATPTSNLQAFP